VVCRYLLIDSHVHFYDCSRPEGVLWPPAGSSYPLSAFYSDLVEFARPVEIEGVILVETGSRKADDDWLFNLAEKNSRILGVVAHLQPGEAGFKERLRKYSDFPKLKGIRLRPIERYDLKDSRLRGHLKLLSNSGLTLELGATSNEKMIDYIDLAKELSGVSCGLTHSGHPTIDGEPPGSEWSESVSQFAALRNTFCKLTSLCDFTRKRPATENPDYYRPVVEFLMTEFGEDRIIFGSNWPRSASPGGYKTNVSLYQQILGGNEIALEKLLHLNARRIFGLG